MPADLAQPLRMAVEPAIEGRDPCLHLHGGVFRCCFTAVAAVRDRIVLHPGVTTSRDLCEWTSPTPLVESPLGFSSPGNILRVGARWVLCLQSYPVPPGQAYADDSARLWLMESSDLRAWTPPRPMAPEGCRARWARSPRQIDPYLVEHDGRFWCLYKAAGCLGLLVSADLEKWEEASPDRPVLAPAETPDRSTVENPCVVRDGAAFVLFFAPCRPCRGIGVARSDDLLRWRDVRYLDFPALPWAPGGPSAAMVVDWREAVGHWVMAFHGETGGPHGARLGLAWSDDLERWHCG